MYIRKLKIKCGAITLIFSPIQATKEKEITIPYVYEYSRNSNENEQRFQNK